MKYIWSAAILLLCLHMQATAQTRAPLRGKITIPDGSPLVGSTVLWDGTKIGTMADTAGRFSIQRMDTVANLVIRYIGLEDLFMEILPNEQDVWIEVKDLPEQVLKEVKIQGKNFDNSVSLLSTRHIESINGKELRKAPCCNLSESFETNNSVDVAYPNPVTGVREVQLLGLRGTYSMFLVENRPAMKGIAAPYAFEFYPGTWLRGIQIAKGATTVVNGSEGITGQINVELQRPDRDKPVFFNAYANSGNRAEANLHLNRKGKGAFSHGLLTHGSVQRSPFDHNQDNFYDMQSREQLNGMYRLIYETDDWCGQVSAHALTDRRSGGQIDASANGARFPFEMQNDRAEVTAKLGRTSLGGKPYKELGNIAHFASHHTNGVVGNNTYDAVQKSVFLQTLYKTIIKTTDHQLQIAPNLAADVVTERLNDAQFDRRELVAGAMAEYSYLRPDLHTGSSDMGLVLGLRTDYNSLFGLLISPRASFRYNLTEKTVFRLSAGKGYHSPFLIAENISWLATNKTLDFAAVTHAESAWNYGLNFVQKFKVFGKESSISIDLFRTDFERQLLIDQETRPDTVAIYYTTAPAWAQTGMATFQMELTTWLDLKLATKMQDVQATYQDGVRRWLPMVARHRSLISLDFNVPNEKWAATTTLHLVGNQRLPKNEGAPHLHGNFPERTPVYPVMSAQLTRKWKRFEVYVGGENLTAYTQHHQIISANDPSSKFFNASQVWAPSFGRMAFVGLRVVIRE
jgi:outer membrane receptor for ferrienterochelin and colicins